MKIAKYGLATGVILFFISYAILFTNFWFIASFLILLSLILMAISLIILILLN